MYYFEFQIIFLYRNSGGSLLDERNEVKMSTYQRIKDNDNTMQLQPPVHKHSRSLPIEIAGQDFAAAYAAYRQAASTISNVERPKSAFVYTNPEEEKSASTRGYSSARGRSSHLDFPLEGSSNMSKSSDDLLNDGRRSNSITPPALNADSANELRQAASKYHQELMKNYPKFRLSISGKEAAVPKYPRRLSDDNFSRGEPLRATIATTHVTNNSRTPRSFSGDGQSSLNMSGGENSLMARLLQGQTPASLVKIEEEAKKQKEKDEPATVRRSNSIASPNIQHHHHQQSRQHHQPLVDFSQHQQQQQNKSQPISHTK